jgi:nucleoside 2-deoxyribosyltransferase
MLNIIGGSYIENCIDPPYHELYGSGLRAAAALANKGFKIKFHSCICKELEALAILKSSTFGYTYDYSIISKTIEFDYYHPLSKPIPIINENSITQFNNIRGENILYYGMIEAIARINGDYVVYDPQNHKSFIDTGSSAKHLAVILNKKEALSLSKIDDHDLTSIGKDLLMSENAEIIVIKNGVHGALVFEGRNVYEIPVFKTNTVWPIGTGDVFSAVFAWKWMIEKNSAYQSAYQASQFTAQYCQSKQLPLSNTYNTLEKIEIEKKIKNIYLAGPFFTIAERWLINELRNILIDFGNTVFSPYHDVGIIDSCNIKTLSSNIADKDLEGLSGCDAVLAIISGLDAGTLFEIGYAKSLNKKIVILAQNVNTNDLTMFIGTGCEITNDFSTAIYSVSW